MEVERKTVEKYLVYEVHCFYNSLQVPCKTASSSICQKNVIYFSFPLISLRGNLCSRIFIEI